MSFLLYNIWKRFLFMKKKSVKKTKKVTKKKKIPEKRILTAEGWKRRQIKEQPQPPEKSTP